MPSDPLFWGLASLAVLFVGFSKGGFAGGGAIAGVPVLTLVTDPVTAVAVMLPLLLFMDVIAVIAYQRKWSASILKTMVPGAIIGIAIGTFTFSVFNADVIRLILGTIVIAFALNFWLRRDVAEARAPRPPSFTRGAIFGSMSGFTSFVAHAGHPPIAFYLLPQKLDRTTYQATSVLFFFIVNWAKLPPYAFLGLFDSTNLMTSAILAPLVPVGIFMGIWLHKRVTDQFFTRTLYGVLLVLGLKLAYDGAAGLI